MNLKNNIHDTEKINEYNINISFFLILLNTLLFIVFHHCAYTDTNQVLYTILYTSFFITLLLVIYFVFYRTGKWLLLISIIINGLLVFAEWYLIGLAHAYQH